MKLKKLCAVLLTMALFIPCLTAQEEDTTKSRWSFSTTTDFAYYPKSNQVVADKAHFAPITGPYSGLEGRIVGEAAYTIPVPMGSNWLVSDATLKLAGKLELTPVTLKPIIETTWTPLPFLVFTAGAEAATGWNLFGLQGMALYDKTSNSYTDCTPFTSFFLKWYAQGTFQFDTGALIKGDWTHVQMMYTYQTYYEYLTSAAPQEVWMWQCAGDRTNGLSSYQNFVLAYAMPIVLSRVGVMGEINGHYKNSDYEFDTYNGSFKEISISPLAQFTFGEHDGLSVLLGFSSRRGYTTEVTDSDHQPYKTFANREWYFKRLAFSWTHTF